MTKELWKSIPSYPKYEASNLGRIRNKKSERILSANIDDVGYYRLFIPNAEGKPKAVRVHSLISEAFLGERPLGLEVDHRNANRLDNRICNLRYLSRSENQLAAVALGRKPGFVKKLTAEDALEIRALNKLGWSRVKIAKLFPITLPMISLIVHNQRWAKAA